MTLLSMCNLRCMLFSGHARSQLLSSIARQISSLVIVEHNSRAVSPATLSAVSAAAKFKGPITALVAGHNIDSIAKRTSAVEGVEKVLVADHEALKHQLAEPFAELIAALQNRRNFTHLLAASSTFGKNLLPRAAALLDAQPVGDVLDIVSTDTFTRPIYAGNAIATVKHTGGGVKMLTVRPTSFPPVSSSGGSAPIESVSPEELAAAVAGGDIGSMWLRDDVSESSRPELGAAKVVVCGGRALKSKENFAILERLADLLGGAVGASRAAVDAGYVANDLQVGQTGKVVAPQLYLAIGISGAIQHVAGMKDSKTIVAINTDAEAPIFQLADYGLVQDLFTALPELEEELRKAKAAAQ